jgi:hypothetical protein
MNYTGSKIVKYGKVGNRSTKRSVWPKTAAPRMGDRGDSGRHIDQDCRLCWKIHMESACFEVEPNRNAEAYRNYQPAALPAHVEKYMDFIEFCEGKYCANRASLY